MSNFLTVSKAFIKRNGSVIMTVVSLGCGIGLAYFTAKATLKANKDVEKTEMEEGITLTVWDKVKLCWVHYIPAAVCLIGMTATGIGSTVQSKKKEASLISAAAMSEAGATRIKKALPKVLSDKKAEEVRVKALQDSAKENLPENQDLILNTGKGSTLINDIYTGRWFRADPVEIEKAVNKTCEQIKNEDYASLSDFYDRINLRTYIAQDVVGWHIRFNGMFDVRFIGGDEPYDNQPYLIMEYSENPIPGFESEYEI